MDFNEIMKQSQRMQEEMLRQEKLLKEKEYHNSQGKELVEVTMNGNMEVKAVKIKEEFVNNFTTSDKELLEKAIGEAFEEINQAIKDDQEQMAKDVVSGFSF